MSFFFKIIFIVHFFIVFLFLIGGLYKISFFEKLTKPYIDPFFEQNWGMFSNPPLSTRRIFFQYKMYDVTGKVITSDWYDINKSIYSLNKKKFFSIAQRLIKYESGCINNILIAMKECDNVKEMTCVENTKGYKSFIEYAKIIYNKNIKSNDDNLIVSFRLKILEDFFPSFEHRSLDFYNKNNHHFKEYTSDFKEILK